MITMDYRLIELCKAGDSAAVEDFVQTYQREVYCLALSILDDSHEAEDATQESLLAALRGLENYKGQSSLKTWLFSITVNTCRTRLQRRKRAETLKQILNGIFQRAQSPSVEEDAIQNASNEALWGAVHSMDAKYRIPIVLRYVHDLSVAEISKILQIPEGTVHSRLNTARRKLHAVLKEGSS
jgi:RNA polymerase sigma-70 factor (ECF subfamily)